MPDNELLRLAYQYRDDLRYPPSPDSVQRRLAAIEAAIAKVTASEIATLAPQGDVQ